MTPTEIPVESLCRRLHLANAPRIYQALAERAEREQWSYVHFLSVLFAEEVAHRTQTRLSRLTHKAEFPFFKTIDDFDFTFQSTLRLAMLGSYLSPDFVTEGRGRPKEAADYYRQAAAFIEQSPDGFDEESLAYFRDRADQLDPSSSA